MNLEISTVTTEIEGTLGMENMFESMVKQASQGKDPLSAATKEAICNSYDARSEEAPWVKVLYQPGEMFRIQDNGRGVDFEGIKTLYSLFASGKAASDRETIGQNGTGRICFFNFADTLCFFSSSEELRALYLQEMDAGNVPKRKRFKNPLGLVTLNEQVFHELRTPGKKQKLQWVEAPEWWPFAPGENGTILSVEDINWDLLPKVSVLRRKMTHELKFNPWMLSTVTINGRALKRPDVGEKIEFEITDPDLGKVRFEAYHPQPKDTLQIGSDLPLETWADFYRQLDALADELDPIMANPMVHGALLVEVLASKRGHASKLDPGIYVTPEWRPKLQSLVRLINKHIVPLIKKFVNAGEDAGADENQLVSELGELSRMTYGDQGTFEGKIELFGTVDDENETTKEGIILNHTHIKVPCGGREEIEILSYRGTSGVFEWLEGDDYNHGGVISQIGNTNHKIEYVAGNVPGHYQLIVRDVNDHQKFTVLKITIIPRRQGGGGGVYTTPEVYPAHFVLVAGGPAKKFTLRGGDTSRLMKSRILDEFGEEVYDRDVLYNDPRACKRDDVAFTRVTATHQAPEVDKYVIEFFDPEDEDYRFQGTFDVIVKEPEPQVDPLRLPDLDEPEKLHCYVLELNKAGGYFASAIMLNPQNRELVLTHEGKKTKVVASTMVIDLNHPYLEAVKKLAKSGNAYRYEVLRECVKAHVKRLAPNIHLEDFDLQVIAILKQFKVFN